MERRASARIRCHLVCQLQLDEGIRAGAIVDLSKGGMRLLCDRSIDRGEPVRVKFAPREGKTIDVDTLVWHTRRVGRSKFAIGLVLSEPSDDYFAAVAGLDRTRELLQPAPAQPSRERSEPRGTATFCLRARQHDSPRSRTLYVDADSPEQARTRACHALGPDWSVIETRRA